ncbi:MAG: hypothetical protein HYY20_03615 [Candidatus Tectomicrobia bacterium]|uniref:Uncharacterized protein n=1 Tax=Tectimicrobiota bacterium TaxID=2528274 RepID=A0A932CNK1_UNCTE|nr:hypothetical protein [Candidatus Tectomicrobia bacterium]
METPKPFAGMSDILAVPEREASYRLILAGLSYILIPPKALRRKADYDPEYRSPEEKHSSGGSQHCRPSSFAMGWKSG